MYQDNPNLWEGVTDPFGRKQPYDDPTQGAALGSETPPNMDLNPGSGEDKTIIDLLSPTQLYFGHQLAINSKSQSQAAGYLPLFSLGIGPGTIYGRENQAIQSKKVLNIMAPVMENVQSFAQDTAHLKDEDYNKAKENFVKSQADYIHEQTNGPQRQHAKTKMPDALSLGFALFGAAMNPRYASNILAAPFHASLDVQQAKQGQYDQKYEDDLNAHRERLQALGTIAQQAYRDVEVLRQQNSDDAKRLSSAIGRILTANFPGEAKIAFQEAIDAGLPQDRIEHYAPMVNAKEDALTAQFTNKQANVQAGTDQKVAKTEADKELLPGKVEGQTLTNEQKKAQTEATKQKTAESKALLPGKLKEQQAKLDRFSEQNTKDEAQITRWKQQRDEAVAKGTFTRDKFEWQKATKGSGGLPAIDKKVIDLQTRKAGLLAEAETWRKQAEPVPGLIKRETPQMNQALAKIQREIANIDAHIKTLRGMGAKAGVTGDIGSAKITNDGKSAKPVKVTLPGGVTK